MKIRNRSVPVAPSKGAPRLIKDYAPRPSWMPPLPAGPACVPKPLTQRETFAQKLSEIDRARRRAVLQDQDELAGALK